MFKNIVLVFLSYLEVYVHNIVYEQNCKQLKINYKYNDACMQIKNGPSIKFKQTIDLQARTKMKVRYLYMNKCLVNELKISVEGTHYIRRTPANLAVSPVVTIWLG